MKKIKYLILVASIVMPVAGCTNMSKTQQGTLSGGAIGAGAGLGIAAVSGGNLWVGTAVGAGAGALAGYMISK
ncbi:MAG: YMGG-like glycine zipper-containing protein [Candidatus Dadabacteria bacterium]|nr:YMGG-like glycine zipper-containing protein [Candidatus Dadabacteria bacterium]